MSTDTAISVCTEVTRVTDDERAVYTCSRPAGHNGDHYSVSDPLADQRSLIEVSEGVIHVRVPEADYRNGKTVAFAVRLPGGQWRAQLTTAAVRKEGVLPTVAECDTRAEAERWLLAATDWARRAAL